MSIYLFHETHPNDSARRTPYEVQGDLFTQRYGYERGRSEVDRGIRRKGGKEKAYRLSKTKNIIRLEAGPKAAGNSQRALTRTSYKEDAWLQTY